MEQGLKIIAEDKNVIDIFHGTLKSFFNENPFHSQKLRIFAKQRPVFGGFYLTKNCPLVPALRRGMTVLREKGVVARLKEKWEGKEPPRTFGVETETLGVGQVIVVFVIIVSALVVSAVIFSVEMAFSKMFGQFVKRD